MAAANGTNSCGACRRDYSAKSQWAPTWSDGIAATARKGLNGASVPASRPATIAR